MSCICGGQFIEGPFGDGTKRSKDERMQQMVEALDQLVRQAPGSTRLTLDYWAELRQQLAIDLVLAHLIEHGQIEVSHRAADGEPGFVIREPSA
jgi:hypothetical protein